MSGDFHETRQERRAKKLTARRERMRKHGASLARVYVDAVRKRATRALEAARHRAAPSSEDRR